MFGGLCHIVPLWSTVHFGGKVLQKSHHCPGKGRFGMLLAGGFGVGVDLRFLRHDGPI